MKTSLLIHELSHGATYALKSASGVAVIWVTENGDGLAECPADYRGDALDHVSVRAAGPVSDFLQRSHRWPDNFAEVMRVGRFLPHSTYDLKRLEVEDPDDLEVALVDAILGVRAALMFAKAFPTTFTDAASMLAKPGDGVAIELSTGGIVPLHDLQMAGTDPCTVKELQALAGVRH